MDGLILFFNITFIAIALISLISYAARRSEDRDALQALREAPSFRTLDNDERQAIEPSRKKLKATIVSGQVHRLSGNYERHGISANGGETMHDTIGGVEVLLPYDAADYLDVHNHAEVVVTAKIAIVVRLNGFHVAEGYQRQQAQSERQHAWDAGQITAAFDPPASSSTALPAHAAADTVATDSHTLTATAAMAETAIETTDDTLTLATFEVLGQRKESTEEIAAQSQGYIGFVPAGLWLMTFTLLWLGSLNVLAWQSTLLLGTITAGLALWKSRKPSITTERACDVNQVHGPLNVVEMTTQGGESGGTHLLLGDSKFLTMPPHWLRSGRIPFGDTLHLDVRTRDDQVLAMGKGWSLADEQRRFPHVRWGHHVTLLVVALLGLLVAVLSSSNVMQDFELAGRNMLAGQTRTDTSAATLLQDPPRPGDRVQLQGQAFCELTLTELMGSTEVVALPDCSRMRWGEQPVDLADVSVPDAIAKLGRNSFLKAAHDPTAALAELMRRSQASPFEVNPFERARNEPSEPPAILFNLAQMTDLVERACDAGLNTCQEMQRELVTTLAVRVEDGSDLELNTWPLLAGELHRLAETGHDRMRISGERLLELRRIGQKHANLHLLQKLQQLTPQLLSAQQGGVAFIAPDTLQIATDQLPLFPDSTHIGNLAEHWELARKFVSQPIPFAVKGLIVDRHDDAGGLRLEVDTSTVNDRAGEAVINSLWLLLAVLLAGFHAALLYVRLKQSRKRVHALEDDLRQRPVPGAAIDA